MARECINGRPTEYRGVTGWLIRHTVFPGTDHHHLAHSLYPHVRWNYLPAVNRALREGAALRALREPWAPVRDGGQAVGSPSSAIASRREVGRSSRRGRRRSVPRAPRTRLRARLEGEKPMMGVVTCGRPADIVASLVDRRSIEARLGGAFVPLLAEHEGEDAVRFALHRRSAGSPTRPARPSLRSMGDPRRSSLSCSARWPMLVLQRTRHSARCFGTTRSP